MASSPVSLLLEDKGVLFAEERENGGGLGKVQKDSGRGRMGKDKDWFVCFLFEQAAPPSSSSFPLLSYGSHI